MTILPFYDILYKYIELKKEDSYSLPNNEYIRVMLENANNKIALPSHYRKYVKNRIRGMNNSYDDILEKIFLKWMDGGRLNKEIICGNKSSLCEEFVYLENSFKDKNVLSFSHDFHSDLTPLQNNIAIHKKINKPNSHWLRFNLCANHKINAYPKDFKNAEVEDFFKAFFSLNRNRYPIFIRDDYCNIRLHKYFDSIANKGYNIGYYLFASKNTTSKKLDLDDLKQKHDDIKAKLGKSTKVYFTDKTRLKHQRQILFNNYILKSDNDFSNIDKNNKGWSLDIYFEKEWFADIMEDLNNYKEFTP